MFRSENSTIVALDFCSAIKGDDEKNNTLIFWGKQTLKCHHYRTSISCVIYIYIIQQKNYVFKAISWRRTARFFGSSLKARWGRLGVLKKEVLEKQVLKPRNVIGKWEGKNIFSKTEKYQKIIWATRDILPTNRKKKPAISQIYLLGKHLSI